MCGVLYAGARTAANWRDGVAAVQPFGARWRVGVVVPVSRDPVYWLVAQSRGLWSSSGSANGVAGHGGGLCMHLFTQCRGRSCVDDDRPGLLRQQPTAYCMHRQGRCSFQPR